MGQLFEARGDLETAKANFREAQHIFEKSCGLNHQKSKAAKQMFDNVRSTIRQGRPTGVRLFGDFARFAGGADKEVVTVVSQFKESQVIDAAKGRAAAAGGLSVGDIRKVLAAVGLPTTGIRKDLERHLKTYLEDQLAAMQKFFEENSLQGAYQKCKALGVRSLTEVNSLSHNHPLCVGDSTALDGLIFFSGR